MERLVRYEIIEDMGDIVTIAHRFPVWISNEQADSWMAIKADVQSEVVSRVQVNRKIKSDYLRLVSA